MSEPKKCHHAEHFLAVETSVGFSRTAFCAALRANLSALNCAVFAFTAASHSAAAFWLTENCLSCFLNCDSAKERACSKFFIDITSVAMPSKQQLRQHAQAHSRQARCFL
jgi:hypothetical protein